MVDVSSLRPCFNLAKATHLHDCLLFGSILPQPQVQPQHPWPNDVVALLFINWQVQQTANI